MSTIKSSQQGSSSLATLQAHLQNAKSTSSTGSAAKGSAAAGSATTESTKTAQKPSNSSAASLKQVTQNIPQNTSSTSTQNTTSTKNSLTDKIGGAVNKGIEYLKEARDQAVKDRAAGMGAKAGADKYWNDLMKQVDKIGRQSQDKILDDLGKETGNLISDAIKGSKLEEWVGKLIPSLGKTSGATTSSNTSGNNTTGTNTSVNPFVASTQNSGITIPIPTSSSTQSQSSLAGITGAAYSLYQLIDGHGKDSPVASAANGATVGAYIGSFFAPGIGTAIGGLVGGIAGAASSFFGKKKKHPEHAARDQMRGTLQKAGFLDKNYAVKLTDGSSFSLSIDGKKRLDNLDGNSRFGYQFDPSNPLSGPAIGMLQPLAWAMTGGNQKLATDLTGYLVNAVTSNAKDLSELRSNVIALYDQSGADLESVAEVLMNLAEKNIISEHHHEAYIGGLMSVADEEVLRAISESSISTQSTAQNEEDKTELKEKAAA